MDVAPVVPSKPERRSTLITVVAWLFLVLGALGTLAALMRVFVLAVTPAVTINAAVNRVAQDTAVTNLFPAPYLFMLHHVRLVAFLKLLWWSTVVGASVGVLQRREWARRTFVVVLGLWAIAAIVGVVVGQSIGFSLVSQIASQSGSGQAPPGIGTGMALAGLIGFGLFAILLWLFFTFRSARVREEFRSARRAA